MASMFAPSSSSIALLGRKLASSKMYLKCSSTNSSVASEKMDLGSFDLETPISELMKEEKHLACGKVVPFTTLQILISQYTEETLNVPMLRVGYTIKMTALDILHKRLKREGVTMTALLIKATALALAQHPVMIASCKDGKSISHNSSINIAVAVAIDGGLITPVIQNADEIDIYTLSRKWSSLVYRARTKQLKISECLGETFAISNMGMFGVNNFDGGQSGIIALGSSKPSKAPVYEHGVFSIENQMQVTVTADGRIAHGDDVAAFLQTLAKIIEVPTNLTL